ncbi:DUF305 domain-containing protein [Cereibacter azotoformans]|uniref:DUF305 domain-containing protein n=1 Tax=Cereibacter azotoformans TaxID=43057 RepID=UPI001EEAE29B|nr:DUF305 domain-containing protein [Cereibacter azotoformans]ULB11283.1 DUF305 domain-containing protein [Cereibacter azotoformans]
MPAPSAGDAAALPAACQTSRGGMMDHGGMMQMRHGGGAASEGFGAVMQKMQGAMMMAMAIGDPDLVFACGMIPHHQGAISIVRTVQQHGKDQTIKAMAQKMIDDQTQEIKELTDWIGQHGQR